MFSFFDKLAFYSLEKDLARIVKYPGGVLPKSADGCVPRKVLNPDLFKEESNENQTKIDTQTRRFTAYEKETIKTPNSFISFL